MEKNNSTTSYQQLTGGSGNQWHHASGLNDMFVTGCYKVRLSHSDAEALGIEVDKCGADHYIIGYLFVTESGTDDKLQHDRTVGQTLILTDCNGKSQQRFTRTCRFGKQGASWNAWERYPDTAELKQLATGLGATVEWGDSSNIDTFVTAGTYNITGQRTNAADNLPLSNAAPGHSINARLIILDSSIPGNGDSHDKCITQILAIANRTGSDGDIYVRTGRASIKNILASGSGWEPWGKLQQNIAVGHATSLDTYIDNGVYSGVYSNGNAIETFVMIVINNYDVAGANGSIRSISQFKYALNIDGTFSYRSRSGQGNTGISWGQWVDLNGATTAMLQDGAVTAQKLSADVREKVNNPLRPLFIAAGAEYNDTGADKTKSAPLGETVTHKAGHYYLNGLGDITEEQMNLIYANSYVIYNINLPRLKENDKKIRTIIPVYNSHGVSTLGKASYSTFAGCPNLEILVWSSDKYSSLSNIVVERLDVAGSHMFNGCSKLRYVHPMKCTTSGNIPNMFGGCTSLIETKIYEVKGNISFSDSMMINKDSILCLIQNAVPTTAITITLHPDAYARLADDADIVAALEKQPLVSLVSA